IIRDSDASIVHSTAEYELVHRDLPKSSLHAFPLIMNVTGSNAKFSKRKNIVFIGGYQHTPNVDAVVYFATEIMPLLRTRLPGVCFFAVGSKPPIEIQNLASNDILITGFIEELTPLLDKMRVSVAPLRYGAGIKGKIGTAMAAGVPVVATTIAAEGMSLIDGENIIVADGPQKFADAVVKLYHDESLWESISSKGLTFADNTWGANSAWHNLASIINCLGFQPTTPSRELSLYSQYVHMELPTESEDKKTTTHPQNEAYQKKIQQELDIYEKQFNVHDLPEIYHYWSNKYIAPLCLEAGFSTVAEFFSSNLLKAKDRTGTFEPIFVSVGAGNCDLEVSVARNLITAGLTHFTLECLEINPSMLKRGLEIAKENGVQDNMKFIQADFNSWVAQKKYDGVMANQSLHHVTDLEHLFDQVKSSLHAEGSVVVSDIIGRNGHQRWPESLDIVNKYWVTMPKEYKFNALLNRFEDLYDNWDCSKEGFEGIRAQDVLPLLLDRFSCEKFVGFGNVIDIFVDRAFGHGFREQTEWDLNFIDQLHAEDETGLASGRLTPTHMMAVFVKNLRCAPYYSRGVSPTKSIRKTSYEI
uniref:glycosyltransferase n=1 Tax=Undibacterium sp. TaxID=1914977 RepID=UPI003751EF63